MKTSRTITRAGLINVGHRPIWHKCGCATGPNLFSR